jgi:hypothetical protein
MCCAAGTQLCAGTYIDDEQGSSSIVTQHRGVLDEREQRVVHCLLHLLELGCCALHLVLLVLHLAQGDLHVHLTTCAGGAQVGSHTLTTACAEQEQVASYVRLRRMHVVMTDVLPQCRRQSDRGSTTLTRSWCHASAAVHVEEQVLPQLSAQHAHSN